MWILSLDIENGFANEKQDDTVIFVFPLIKVLKEYVLNFRGKLRIKEFVKQKGQHSFMICKFEVFGSQYYTFNQIDCLYHNLQYLLVHALQ